MLVLVLVLVVLGFVRRAHADDVKILLYDPDAAVPSLRVLRSGMQEYLSSRRPGIRFLPYEKLDDFRRAVQTERPQLAIVAAWTLRQEGARLGMRAVLSPTRGGRATYEKRLVTTDPQLDAAALRGQTLATTRMGPDESTLDQLVFQRLGFPARELKIVYVSKGIDALLALTFGQVKAALVTEDTVAALAKSDPDGARRLVTLLESKEIPLAPLVVFPASCPDSLLEELLPLFSQMGDRPEGRRLLKLLRLDGWQAPPPKLLERSR